MVVPHEGGCAIPAPPAVGGCVCRRLSAVPLVADAAAARAACHSAVTLLAVLAAAAPEAQMVVRLLPRGAQTTRHVAQTKH